MPKTGRRTDAHKSVNLPPRARTPAKLADGLDRVHGLIDSRRWLEARDLLYALSDDFPHKPGRAGFAGGNQLRVAGLAAVPDGLRATAGCESGRCGHRVCAGRRVYKKLYARAALRQLNQAIARFPRHEQAATARQRIGVLESYADDMLTGFGVHGAEGRELSEQHENSAIVITPESLPRMPGGGRTACCSAGRGSRPRSTT